LFYQQDLSVIFPACSPFMLTGQVVQAAVGKDVAPVDPITVTPAAATAVELPQQQQQQQQVFSSVLEAAEAKWRLLQRWLPEHIGWQKWQLQKWPEASGKDVLLWEQ
jgi:hypothetical protein